MDQSCAGRRIVGAGAIAIASPIDRLRIPLVGSEPWSHATSAAQHRARVSASKGWRDRTAHRGDAGTAAAIQAAPEGRRPQALGEQEESDSKSSHQQDAEGWGTSRRHEHHRETIATAADATSVARSTSIATRLFKCMNIVFERLYRCKNGRARDKAAEAKGEGTCFRIWVFVFCPCTLNRAQPSFLVSSVFPSCSGSIRAT